MLLRISLIVTILAGLAIGALSFTKVKEKIVSLQTHLKEEIGLKEKALGELASTKKELKKTADNLKQTQATLAATTEERDTALRNLDSKTKLAEKVTSERDKALKDLDDTRGELEAYKVIGWKPEEIAAFKKNYTNLRDQLEAVKAENALFLKRIKNLEIELALYKDPEASPELPASIKGKVLVMDPKWNFVVLNVGEDLGVLKGGEFLVHRDGKLIAKVRVNTLQKDRCIANIEPGFKLGEPIEGDLIMPARPKS
ncbi:MAG: hypothetical protein C5B50_19620 [Verrucomicrobia bacterium]|nr:MAG: hypothetical protein C5B50_19620 [Verrucomicrobiota bacterium]